MPANLPPQYLKAEEEYRRAQTPDEQIVCLEKMLMLIPKHKGTDRLQADLKTRLKETRAEAQADKSSKKVARSYRIPRQGAGTVIVLGAPNAGKSRLVDELTDASPEVAAYPFTTREPFPAMMPWENIQVQLIDTPPVTASNFEPYLVGFVRTADLVLLCFDGSSDDAPEETFEAIQQFVQRKTLLAANTGFDEEDFTRLCVKTLLVVTRAGDPDCATRLDFYQELSPPALPRVDVEFDNAESVAKLRDAVFQALGVIRIYTKAPGKPTTQDDPFTIPVGGTVEDLAGRVHRELAEKLKFARVWGTSAHDGQSVGRDHVLSDGDTVELHA